MFDEATSIHTIDVLHKAIAKHGKPASILTDHGSQFYANAGECKKAGTSKFEQELVSLGIKHILARVGHPQTNGKLERFHGELQQKLYIFTDSDATKTTRGVDSSAYHHIGNPFHTEGHRIKSPDLWNGTTMTGHTSHWALIRQTPAVAAIRKMPTASSTNIQEVEEEDNKRKEKKDP